MGPGRTYARRVLAAQGLPQKHDPPALVAKQPKATATVVNESGLPLRGRDAVYQRWISRSAVGLPQGMSVVVRPATADEQTPTNAAAWVTSTGDIVIPPGRQLTQHEFLHELGHVVDAKYLTPQARAEIASRDLHDNGPWSTDGDPSAGATPGVEETFAENFAALAQHRKLAAGYVGPNYASARPLSLAAQRDLRYKLAILAKYQVQDGRLAARSPQQ